MKFSLILLLLSTSVGWSQCTGFSYRASMTTSGQASSLSGFDSILGDTYDSDECRIETVVRNADFIAARYNAQNSPSSFITMGSPVSLGSIPFKRIFRVGD